MVSSCGRPIRSVAPPSPIPLPHPLVAFVARSHHRDHLVNLGVDAHRVLAIRPTVLVERLVRGHRGLDRFLFGPFPLSESGDTSLSELHAARNRHVGFGVTVAVLGYGVLRGLCHVV